jgi:hypothetical protein
VPALPGPLIPIVLGRASRRVSSLALTHGAAGGVGGGAVVAGVAGGRAEVAGHLRTGGGNGGGRRVRRGRGGEKEPIASRASARGRRGRGARRRGRAVRGALVTHASDGDVLLGGLAAGGGVAVVPARWRGGKGSGTGAYFEGSRPSLVHAPLVDGGHTEGGLEAKGSADEGEEGEGAHLGRG